MAEVTPPVFDLPVIGTAGDAFLLATTVSTPTNPIGIMPSMDVRGDGVDANTITANYDPADPLSPAYSGPDAAGNYTIYLTQPLIGSVTTASFTYYQLKDITPR